MWDLSWEGHAGLGDRGWGWGGGSLGFKALELGGDVGLQRNGKCWTARTSKQTCSSLRSVCRSARRAGNLWRKRRPPWIPISLCDLGQVPSLLHGAGLAVAVVQHSDESRK